MKVEKDHIQDIILEGVLVKKTRNILIFKMTIRSKDNQGLACGILPITAGQILARSAHRGGKVN